MMHNHLDESINFSIKYISVVFKWLSNERKQGAIELMNRLITKEQIMSQSLLGEFIQNIDTDIIEPFLRQIKKISLNRLEMINTIMENIK